MAGENDLTTLTVVQEWLSSGGASPGNSDSVLSRLITTCSASIMSYLQRSSFLSQAWAETFDGHGGCAYFLNEWPVTAVNSVTVDGIVVPQSIGREPGWKLSAWNGYPPGGVQMIELSGGYSFTRGRQNITISYVAGYRVSNEPKTVPAMTAYAVTVNQGQGSWVRDEGVTYANGTPLVLVTALTAAGQYTVAAGGIYTFDSADHGAAVLISYSYVPSSVEDAAMNWVSERYKYRGRIGQRSQNIGGQTTNTYDVSDIPSYIKTQLQQYRKVLPV